MKKLKLMGIVVIFTIVAIQGSAIMGGRQVTEKALSFVPTNFSMNGGNGYEDRPSCPGGEEDTCGRWSLK